MKKLFDKVWGWYKNLPWWGKIIGALALLLVVLLGVLYVVSKFFPGGRAGDLKTIDELTGDHTDELIEHLDGEADSLKDDIKKKKKELATKINQAEKIDAKTLERREKISNAATMEELLALQEEMDL